MAIGGNQTVGVTVAANMDISQILSGVKSMQGAFNGLKLPTNLTTDVIKEFDKLKTSLGDYKKLMEKTSSGKTTKADIKAFDKLEKDINKSFSRILSSYDELSGKKIYLEADSSKIKEVQKDIDKLKNDLQTKFSNFKLEMGTSSGKSISMGLDKTISDMDKAVKSSKVLSAAMKEVQSSVKAGDFSGAATQLGNIQKQAVNLKGASTGLLTMFKQWGLIDFSKPASQIAKTTEGTRLLDTAFTKLISSFSKANGSEIKTLTNDLQIAIDKKAEFEQSGAKNYNDAVAKQTADMQQYSVAADQATQANNQFQQSALSAAQQVEQLQQSTQYFFSLRNMINLLKRGIDEAIQSVKDLDKAMTATAVVTDYKVSDMWGMLPEYTKIANQLGATTQGAYETMTLYYQQGLDQQQAFELGAETMKMARIAGLDYTKTTDMMTAALRGFNMELNETSAKRVNDVYSELAAITASDTKELGTAMQRTASIAHSAGSSFEGTTAFLAQAIETTREPAENIGTAMKTIIARFQEMKKNPLEVGEVDGEEVNYNKIDAALKTIGVDLKDTAGQFRDFDEVMLDISAKWDTLSQSQQRYIATTAAGSRQQSRFIAMVSNYERTMQLMEAANNSAGASDEQFGKTMDSLESKLNQLHNAWEQFTMGIANNNMIKFAVDGLTGFLNITNDIINTLSIGSGAIKSFLSVFAAFTGLKAAGKVANSLIGGLGGLVDPTSTFSAGFGRGMTGNRQAVNAAQAAAIYQPIVNAIYETSNREINSDRQNSQSIKQGAYEQYNRFKEGNQNLRQISAKGKTFQATDIINELRKYSPQQQNQLMAGLRGTGMTLTQGLLGRYKGGGAEAFQGILQANRSIKGKLNPADYYDTLFDPSKIKQYVDTSTKAGQAAEAYLNGLSEQINKRSAPVLEEMYRDYEQQVRNSMEGALEEDILDTLQTREDFKSNEENQRRASEQATREVLGDEQGPKGRIAGILDGFGKAGAGISQFGMAIQGFSSLLMTSANPAIQTFGAALNSVGNGIMSLGMGISGLTGVFSTVAESGVMLSAFGAAAGAATAALFGVVAVLGGIIAAIHIARKNIKEDAKKLTETYKDRSEKNQLNIANLKEWRSELAVLSQGVDANGLNINLDPSEYARYQEITDSIAEMNPEIIKGYNAQGHAIIDNNKALEKTLALEQNRSEQIADNYTNTKAWNTLLKDRNLSRTSSNLNTKQTDALGIRTQGYELIPKVEMRKQAVQIGRELQKNKDFIDLTDLGIDVDQLAKGSTEATDAFIQNYDKAKTRINNAIDNAGLEWSEKSSKAISEGLSGFSEASHNLDELVQPLYESMSVYANQAGMSKLVSDSLQTPFQEALKNLAEDGNFDSEQQLRESVDSIINEFSHLNTEYTAIMEKVDAARESFADNFNETEYQAKVGEPISDLERLKQEFEDVPGGSALTQWIDNEIAKIKDHTTDGVATIEEAWNSLGENISVAEGAYDNFAKQTEKDFSTASESMKQIYDAAAEGTNDIATHMQGRGDNTYWTAAEELFGDVSNKTKSEVDQMFKDIEPILQEGQAGFDAFYDKVVGSDKLKELDKVSDALKLNERGWIESIDENADPEIWNKVAESLGISENLLVSMLNKGRQFLQMDFSNYGELREALGNDVNTLRGNKQIQYGDNKKGQTLYLTQDELREYMGAADYNDKAKREEKIGALESQAGVKVLKEVEQLTKKDLSEAFGKNITSSLPNLIDKLGQKYNAEDLKTIAQNVFGEKLTDEQWTSAYADYLEHQDYPTLEPLQSIESLVSQIAGMISKNEIENGKLTSDTAKAQDFKEQIFGEKGWRDTLAQRFSVGRDAEGNKLDEYTYNKSLQELEALKSSALNYKNSLDEGLKQNNLSPEQKALYTQEQADIKTYIAKLDEYISSGKEYDPSKEGERKEEPTRPEKPDSAKNDTKDKTEPSKTDKSSESTTPVEKQPLQQLYDWLVTKPREEAEARTQQNQETTRETGEELQAKNKAFWDNFWSESNSAERREQKTGGNQESSTTEDSSKTSSGSEETISAAQALTTGAEGLITASTQLTTAASNLTTAAAVLATSAQKGEQGTKTSEATPAIPAPQLPNKESSISGAIVVDNSGALANLDAVIEKADEAKEKINDGATFKVTVKDSGLTKAAKQASKITKTPTDKNINVTATTSGLEDTQTLASAVKDFQKLNDDSVKLSVKVGGLTDISSAISYANTFYNLRDDTVTLTTIKETINKPGAVGKRNHGYAPAPPKAGSAARGSYGQVGPKGKGGLTLTGELGYEIAWLPSENRSMILGANGPQMVNLPGDAVIWTHEQSKKIIKQKGIPAGSHAKPSRAVSSDDTGYIASRNNKITVNINNNNNNNNNNKNNDKSDKNKSKDSKTKKQEEANAKAAARINVWWDNITRRADETQRRADKNQKTYEKYLAEIQATLKDTGTIGKGNEFIANTQKAIDLYNQQLSQATNDLQAYNTGTAAQQSAQKAVDKAKKTKTKKDDKKAKKQLKKANKQAYMADQGGAVQISYESGKGKKKKTKTEYIDTSQYIKEQDGTYVIDEAALNAVKNKSKRQALADALNKEINDRISKRNAAQDNIEKAQEALEAFGKKLYETFFAWEIELTRIWDITQRLEEAQSRRSRANAYEDLIDAQLGSGQRKYNANTVNETLASFRKGLEAQNQALIERQNALQQNRIDLQKALSSDDEKATLAAVTKKLNDSANLDATQTAAYQNYQKALQDQIAAQDKARQFTTFTHRADGTIQIRFNTAAFDREKQNGNITADMAKTIQDWVKKIEELNKNLNDSYESLTKDMTEYYKNLEDLQKQWADYAKQLREVIEDSEKEKIEKLKKLYDNIKKALDDLLATVKRNLERRRQEESNIRTEQDIRQKQQRLAMLQADTSGGHAVEIAQLQKEIADAQRSYQETLEDQLLARIEEQNDLAAEQRERQIELQEGMINSLDNIEKVNRWMANPAYYEEEIREQFYANKQYDNLTRPEQEEVDRDWNQFFTGLTTNQTKQKEIIKNIDQANTILIEIKEALKAQNLTLEQAKAAGMTVAQAKQKFTTSTYKDIKEKGKYTAAQFKASNVSYADVYKAGFTAKEAKAGGYNNIKSLKDAGYTAQNLKDAGYGFTDLAKAYGANDLYNIGFKNAKDYKSAGFKYDQVKGLFDLATLSNVGYVEAANELAAQKKKAKEKEYQSLLEQFSSLSTHFPNKTTQLFEAGKAIGKNPNAIGEDLGLLGKIYNSHDFIDDLEWWAVYARNGKEKPKVTYAMLEALIRGWRNGYSKYLSLKHGVRYGPYGRHATDPYGRYETGGLADYTGPAWLDGTPSKPELVLNATDTKNFIALKDVLSRAMKSTSDLSSSSGDITYDISINVDKLTSDYDVDKVADRVKKIIVKDASYRNVTQVRKFR